MLQISLGCGQVYVRCVRDLIRDPACQGKPYMRYYSQAVHGRFRTATVFLSLGTGPAIILFRLTDRARSRLRLIAPRCPEEQAVI